MEGLMQIPAFGGRERDRSRFAKVLEGKLLLLEEETALVARIDLRQRCSECLTRQPLFRHCGDAFDVVFMHGLHPFDAAMHL